MSTKPSAFERAITARDGNGPFDWPDLVDLIDELRNALTPHADRDHRESLARLVSEWAAWGDPGLRFTRGPVENRIIDGAETPVTPGVWKKSDAEEELSARCKQLRNIASTVCAAKDGRLFDVMRGELDEVSVWIRSRLEAPEPPHAVASVSAAGLTSPNLVKPERYPAKWYSDATDQYLNPNILNQALGRKRITGTKVNGRCQYDFDSVVTVYPQYRAKLEKYKADQS